MELLTQTEKQVLDLVLGPALLIVLVGMLVTILSRRRIIKSASVAGMSSVGSPTKHMVNHRNES